MKNRITYNCQYSSNRRSIERVQIDTPTTQIHDRSLSWLGMGTSLNKKWGVALVLGAQTSPLSEMMRCFHKKQLVKKKKMYRKNIT